MLAGETRARDIRQLQSSLQTPPLQCRVKGSVVVSQPALTVRHRGLLRSLGNHLFLISLIFVSWKCFSVTSPPSFASRRAKSNKSFGETGSIRCPIRLSGEVSAHLL